MHRQKVLTRWLRGRRALPPLGAAATAFVIASAGCSPAPPTAGAPAVGTEWREFEGTWTAAGSRQSIALGTNRRASVSTLRGSLVLSGAARPAVGFRAEAVVMNDTETGLVGRAVWTDERGDQAWSVLRGEGTATGNRIVGTFVAGTGRYAGVTGDYEFSWRFVLETEDGTVQGQSVGLKGRVRGSSTEGDRR